MKDNKRLNLGCGRNIMEGYVNADMVRAEGVDVCCDFEEALPFDDNTFCEIIVYHVLEHIKGFDNLINELWRISEPGAIIKVSVPYYRNKNAFSDPHHVRFFTENTFDYWISGRKEGCSYMVNSPAEFDLEKVRLVFPRSIFTVIWHIIPVESWHNLWGFIVSSIYYELRVKKQEE
ncbi:methyltransferase domain-containing protein [Elusimicrobiota bacterium]